MEERIAKLNELDFTWDGKSSAKAAKVVKTDVEHALHERDSDEV